MRALLAAIAALVWLPTAAWAQQPPRGMPGEEVLDLLAATRIEEARSRMAELPAGEPWTAAAQAVWAWHRGDYAAAAAHLAQVPPGGRPAEAVAWLAEALPGARSATDGMQERLVGHFLFRWTAGLDDVLIEYASEALEGQRAVLEQLLGASPTEPTVVEIFPRVSGFVAASGLPMDWVETTGTVAIAKWDRMVVLSPSNMPRGYPWMDTLAHEYTHLALARASRNRAPIWFQEGTAKVMESAWRGGDHDAWLDPMAETLLATALAEDRLIPFASMHPSMAALPSSRDAAQAFAQVASAVSWLLGEAGDEGYRRIVQATALHGDVMRAIDQVLGPMGGAFESRYVRQMKSRGLRVRAPIEPFKPELREGSATSQKDGATELDPVLLGDRALQDRTRVGDLLRLRGNNAAAILEYDRAERASTLHSPALANKQARALRALGDVEQAVQRLRASVSVQPEYTPTVSLLAELLSQIGDDPGARAAARKAIALNPYDPTVHRALQAACGRLSDEPCRAREERVLGLLAAPTP
jgi:tetratricopeptide (TPR) repeat protein